MGRNRKFNLGLSEEYIASQIALLLNRNNKLLEYYDLNSILTNNNEYYIEMDGHIVIGCVGLQREATIDKILHLSVNDAYRRRGIASRLLSSVLGKVTQNVVYATIREDNYGSLNLFNKFGFQVVAYKPSQRAYNVLSLCLFRRNNV